MKANYIIYLCLVVLITGCRKDLEIIEVNPGSGMTEVTQQSDLIGLVLDGDGNGIEGATLNLGPSQVTSDENGFYRFSNVDILTGGSLVTVSKDGYIPQFRFAANRLNELSYLNVMMTPEVVIGEFLASDGKTIVIQDKARIKFEPNSILRSDSTLYSGEVVVKGMWYDPFNEGTNALMPGDLRGVDKNGNNVQLATQGMFSIEISDPIGNELLLGGQAELSCYVGEKGVDLDGTSTQPLWYLDEITGEWIEEGSATLQDGFWIGEVSHFSFWNCDYPFALTNISGVVTDESGIPLPNTEIVIRESNSLTTGIGTTNELGYFEAKVPADRELTLYLQGCESGIQLGTFAEGQHDVGIVSIEENTITLIGNIVGCGNEALLNGYVVVKQGVDTKVFYPDDNGNITGSIVACGDIEDWTIFGVNPENSSFSEEQLFQSMMSTLDFGELSICTFSDLFITYDRDGYGGNIFGPFISDLQVLMLDNNCLVIANRIEIPNAADFVIVNPLDESLPVSFFHTGGGGFLTNEIDINFSQLGSEVGEIVEGSWEFEDYSLNFKLVITQVEQSASIVVESWEDDNQNGIHDTNEFRVRTNQVGLKDIAISSSIGYETFIDAVMPLAFRSPQKSNSGYTQFVGLIPDRDYNLFYYNNNTSSYPDTFHVSPHNVGFDEEVDSDFFFEVGQENRYQTDTFYLETGQSQSLYDIGFSDN